MMFSGKLKELPLPEVLKLLSEGRKTGLLSVRILDDNSSKFSRYYISVNKGAISGCFENLDGRDMLTWLAADNKLLTDEQSKQILRLTQDLAGSKNLGEYLTTHNLLNQDQLQSIFKSQVIEPICRLFKEVNGVFIFNERSEIPRSGVLGMQIPITDLTLDGLHQLEDWSSYATHLPEPQAALLQTGPLSISNRFRLNAVETRLFDAADGQVSLADLAKRWNYDIQLLQQAAFCLVVVSIVEELAIANTTSSNRIMAPKSPSIDLLNAQAAHSNRSLDTAMNGLGQLDSNLVALKSIPGPAFKTVKPNTPLPAVGNVSTPVSSAFLDKFSSFVNKRMAENKVPASR